jgi:Protein-L-isoaspartate(D-aspartate) O-methyltransferase (PCMT)
MLEALDVAQGDRFLDIGCGCGYLTACAARLVRIRVHSCTAPLGAFCCSNIHSRQWVPCIFDAPAPALQGCAHHRHCRCCRGLQVGRGGHAVGIDTKSACVALSSSNIARLTEQSPECDIPALILPAAHAGAAVQESIHPTRVWNVSPPLSAASPPPSPLHHCCMHDTPRNDALHIAGMRPQPRMSHCCSTMPLSLTARCADASTVCVWVQQCQKSDCTCCCSC